MKVLIACEESQEVCRAFRALGHEAYSCDIQEPSGGHPEWHIRGDALGILNPHDIDDVAPQDRCRGIEFCTMDKEYHFVEKWDLLIAHPPCTDLAVSGAKWFPEKQKDGRQQRSIVLFMQFALSGCERIAVENPVCIMSTAWRKPDQIIHPWQFGHPEEKTTCLWLKNLEPLVPTDNVKEQMMQLARAQRERNHWMSPGPERAKLRSKTYRGIARAMAEQWGGDIRGGE